MTVDTSGKHLAFEREAIPHLGLVRERALFLTGNDSDADDLVQETYLKAYRFWETYEGGTNIRAWLLRILRNAFINAYRKSSKDPQYFGCDTLEHIHHEQAVSHTARNDLHGGVFDRLLDDHVSRAVSCLSEIFRTPVILRDIEGLTYEEIARFLALPLGTVRSRLHRGRRILQAMLRQYARDRGYVSSL